MIGLISAIPNTAISLQVHETARELRRRRAWPRRRGHPAERAAGQQREEVHATEGEAAQVLGREGEIYGGGEAGFYRNGILSSWDFIVMDMNI